MDQILLTSTQVCADVLQTMGALQNGVNSVVQSTKRRTQCGSVDQTGKTMWHSRPNGRKQRGSVDQTGVNNVV